MSHRAASAPIGRDRARPERVLVVDHAEANGALVTSVPAPVGYLVETAADGVAALERVRRDPPD